MKNITYYNAGAGSGKTYKLTSLLTKLITDGKVKPNEVILTTFTKKAANEFREKAKSMLYKESLFEKAAELDNAMIGTVHSICEQMINKYWYYLGVSPNMGVMDEKDVQFYMSQSLADLPTTEELKQLHTFAYEFELKAFKSSVIDEDFWRSHLLRVIELATNYEITNFNESSDESIKFIKQFVKCDISITDEELNDILAEARNYVEKSNKIKKKKELYDKFDEIKRDSNKKNIAWYKNVEKVFKAHYGYKCNEINERLANLWLSKQVYEIQEKYIKLLFDLASRWQERYSEFKQEKNILDYNDMEKYMLLLLNNEEVYSDISSTYKYLFVDEFQDSSPIQVKIFEKLSSLVKQSYWVGDSKQAIFGFRGSDTDLTATVVEKIKKGENNCNIETLDTSYRSLPDIVTFTNKIFCKTFSNYFNKNEIELKTNRENTENIKSLQYINVNKNLGIPHYVRQLIKEGIAPSDIAVITRTNDELDKIAVHLVESGIPVNIENMKIVDSKSYQLMISLLRILASKNDTLARAEVVMLTDEKMSTKEIIESKLEFDNKNDSKNFFDKDVLISQLLCITEKSQQLSISTAVEQIIVELSLFDWAKRIETNSNYGQLCLKTIMEVAKTYENNCVRLNIPATIDGFINYTNTVNPVAFGDPKGVQLVTYHKSKGLQWKYVILTSLDFEIINERKMISNEIYGTHFYKTEKPSISNLYPRTYIRLTPWIYGAPNAGVSNTISDSIKPHIKDIENRLLAEANRLLYVGVTRAKDVLMLALNETNALQWFNKIGVETNQDSKDFFRTGHIFEEYKLNSDMIMENEVEDKVKILNIETKKGSTKAPRYVSPSSIHQISHVKSVHDFEMRIPLNGENIDMTNVGNCIHNIFACIEDISQEQKNEIVNKIISQYALGEVLADKNSVLQAWQNLCCYLTERFGTATKIYHERPFRMEKNGQTIIGSIDMVWQTEQESVLIDFKTCPIGYKGLTDKNSEYYAGHYGGQLSTYREAMVANGENVNSTIVYYPVAGLAIELENNE